MTVFQLPNEIVFPKPELAEPDGLLAIGGDLSPLRLLTAYSVGIFPWYNPTDPISWWSLDPRLVLFPEEAVFSKSLLTRIKRKEFEIRVDSNCKEVIRQCAFQKRKNQNGTWITDEMAIAYGHLHDLGFVHSFETYKDNQLVGGLYGVSIGGMFTGESMFHTCTDASKVAFFYLHRHIQQLKFDFIDCQQPTSHLMRFGARPIARKDFLKRLEKSMKKETFIGKWELSPLS
ncbi:MAG: leucyl/phenylalanyl-tRNA--protein transferase [Bacteroidales bacterium]|nr:leucyl/phenylalanyl-tRNA--protein transferase [Bacteroidales bacterium]